MSLLIIYSKLGDFWESVVIGIQALFLIVFELFMMINFSIDNYYPVRQFFRNNDWGDVYTYNGVVWKIQLKGNALLPFAFFISMIYYHSKLRFIMATIFLIATLIAGNFAFILGVILFVGLYYMYSKRWTVQKIVLNGLLGIILLSIVSVPGYDYFFDVVKSKSVQSNPTRIDQFEVLINDMNEDMITLLMGQGLGNTVNKKTQWRNYTGAFYYELQAFYILNQVGIPFFGFFIIINMLFAWYFIKYKLLLISYGSYIFYAFFNPYFFRYKPYCCNNCFNKFKKGF